MKKQNKSRGQKIASVIVTVFLCLAAALCLTTVTGTLLRDDPSVFGVRCFFVKTGSMEPTIHQEALVVTKRQSAYKEGDVITFESSDPDIEGMSNTHRILAVQTAADGSPEYVTKGDANPVADKYAVPVSDVYGRVIFHTGKVAWVGSVLDFVMNPKGFLLVIVIPVVLVVASMLKDYVRTWKEAMEQMREENKAELLAELQKNGQTGAGTPDPGAKPENETENSKEKEEKS